MQPVNLYLVLIPKEVFVLETPGGGIHKILWKVFKTAWYIFLYQIGGWGKIDGDQMTDAVQNTNVDVKGSLSFYKYIQESA